MALGPLWTLTVNALEANLPAASGLDVVQYTIGDGPAQDYTAPVTVDPATLGDGAHTFAYGARDNAGNEQWGSVSLLVDRTAPAAVLDDPVDLAGSWYSQDVTPHPVVRPLVAARVDARINCGTLFARCRSRATAENPS
ncbi:MAG TPA: hypothetical protein VJ787_12835 [Thermoleophilia bacterium]|nr:hypothetical protein [Thermoleophilia bacterium]